MKKFILLFFVCLLLISAHAKETVIYENDFSNSDLSAFNMKGKMQVENGTLKASGGGTSAYISYNFPKEYEGKDYIVEVDYHGASSQGGLLIGALSSEYKTTPSYFSGYTCTTYDKGRKAYIAYFNEKGWGGNFAPGTNDKSVHLWVRVQKGEMIFRVTSLDGTNIYQAYRYEPGKHDNDPYNAFSSTVGIRQYCSDVGYFDNFKITVLEDDVIMPLEKRATFCNEEFQTSGVNATSGNVSGTGVLLSEKKLDGNYIVKTVLAAKGTTRLYFGMTDEKNGYAFEINEKESAVFLYRIADGVYSELGEKENVIRAGFCDVTLDVHDGIVSLYYDNYYQGENAFPKFEFYLDNTDGKYGFWLEGGELQNLKVGESLTKLPEETYINTVNPGADPDVLYYEGTYYLYVYAGNDGTNIFRVYTSPDLVNFTERNIVFKWDLAQYDNVKAGTSWSPNVFYNESDGLFYLFFAAEPIDSTERLVYYASSDSPYGPFTHDGPLVALNTDVWGEIDGHPFVGYDGKMYISFSRFDAGGTITLMECTMKDGVVTTIPETASSVIIPDSEWDNWDGQRHCEGGFVWKHDGYYYLIYATGSFAKHYGEAYAVSKNPLGPYEKYEYNPILTHNYALDGPGDALIIPSPDGEELYMVYHRHFTVGKFNPRSTCVDRIEFVENPDGGPDILTVRGPSTTPQKLPSNKYRYDVNRDGKITIADALVTLTQVRSNADYSGYYDVDANGAIGLADVIAILKKI